MDVGNDGLGVCDAMVNVGNDGLGVSNAMVNVGNDGMGVRNDYICVYCKFSLKPVSWRWPHAKVAEHMLKT